MKKIYFLLLTLFAMSFTLASCSDDEPFSTATENDEPRILDPIFPNRENGELPVVAAINRDASFNMELTVTPADYSTVKWYIDGEEVFEGKEIDQQLPAGSYVMKVTVTTTTGKSTYREGIVKVNPLEGDPWSTAQSFERVVAPATTATLYGDNLDKVVSLTIGGTVVTDVQYDAVTNSLTYTVPADLEKGSYRVLLTGAEGNNYGADKVTVTDEPLVTEGAARANANSACTIKGVNLDKIASLTIGTQTISSFVSQTSTELTFTCPSLSDGDYVMTGKTNSGTDVKFYVNGTDATQQTVTISSEMTLWEGHHYVSWDEPDGSPNKTFNFISKEQFTALQPGATLHIAYSLKPDDTYHQLQVMTGWWTILPGAEKIDLTSDAVYDLVLTQEIIDKVQAEDGFLIGGHGFYVDRVSVQ